MGKRHGRLCSRRESSRLALTKVALFLVAAILGVAGAVKLPDPDGFALAVANYHLLPRQALTPVGYLLPPLEVVTALALLYPMTRRAGWLIASALFSIFALAIGSALIRGLDVSCGCFGQALTVSWAHLVANLLLIGLCLWQVKRLRVESATTIGTETSPFRC